MEKEEKGEEEEKEIGGEEISSPLPYAPMCASGMEEKRERERRGRACAPLLALLLATEFPS